MTYSQGIAPTPKVRIFLDVDGVLNAVTATPPTKHWQDWRSAECNGFTIRYSPTMGQRLLALAETEGVELVWLTTWEDDANVWIGPLFGWPEFTVAGRQDVDAQASGLLVAHGAWWKYPHIKEWWERDGVPFVWVDDDLDTQYDDGASAWVRSLHPQALGVRPVSWHGITEPQLAAIERFVHGHLDGPS